MTFADAAELQAGADAYVLILLAIALLFLALATPGQDR